MKKLIIARILAFFTFMLAAIVAAIVLILCGINVYESAIENWAIEVCLSIGTISVCLLYFFSGKRFHDVSLKRLIPLFFIWTVTVFLISAFTTPYLIALNGGFSWISVYIDRVGIAKAPYISGIISFLVEMSVIIMGIFIGRIKAGKTDGKHLIYLSKFFAIIIFYAIGELIKVIFVLVSPDAISQELITQGVHFGGIIAMLPVALWSIYAGFKSFRANLKIVLPVFLLWNAFTLFLNGAFGLWDFLKLGGIYRAFSMGLISLTGGKYLLVSYIASYLLEALFITAGVFLGRYFNKKKGLQKEPFEDIVNE